MTPLALGLVVLAALSHATWNLLTKQSRHQLAFLWWTGLAGAAGATLILAGVLLLGAAGA